jgi:hypothetical protein
MASEMGGASIREIAGDTESDKEANSLQLEGLSVWRYRLGFSSDLRH